MKVDELTLLLMFCEGMRVGMGKPQSETINILMNDAAKQKLRFEVEIERLREMLSTAENHGILATIDAFEINLAKSYERMEELQERVVEFEDRFAKMQEKLENDLASIYIQGITDAATISRLCDQRLDKSGAMLGRVRNIAAALAIIEREEAEGK